jgi:thiol-disulfide isomerase/thioredoxin
MEWYKFNRHPQRLALILMGLFLFACESSSEKEKKEPGIVLILEDSLVYDYLRQRQASLKYIDDKSLPVTIEFQGDSLTFEPIIYTERDFLELVYQDNSHSHYSHLVQKGDSVLVKLQARKPWLQTLNRPTTAYDDNLELMRNRDLFGTAYSDLDNFYFFWNSNYASVVPVELKDELKESRRKAIESLHVALLWIDSLRHEQLIDERTASFHSTKTRFELEKLQFYSEEDGVFDVRGAFQSFLESEWDTEEARHHVYLNEFVDFVLARDKLEHPAPRELELGKKNNTPLGKLLLFKYLTLTLPSLSFKEADKWLNRYSERLSPALISHLKTNLEVLLKQPPDMELMGVGQRATTFEKLLDQKEGKYLYVDLWAAWCIPCIRSFPASRALQEEYGQRGVEVVYLSVDKNHKYWEEVVKKFDIDFPGRSFVTMNLNESDYLKALNVDFIPRYLLFDPQGNLHHPSAPRPESAEIRTLFESLLP